MICSNSWSEWLRWFHWFYLIACVLLLVYLFITCLEVIGMNEIPSHVFIKWLSCILHVRLLKYCFPNIAYFTILEFDSYIQWLILKKQKMNGKFLYSECTILYIYLYLCRLKALLIWLWNWNVRLERDKAIRSILSRKRWRSEISDYTIYGII